MTRLAVFASLLALGLSFGPLGAAERRPGTARRDQARKEAIALQETFAGVADQVFPSLVCLTSFERTAGTAPPAEGAASGGSWSEPLETRSALPQHAPVGQRHRLRDGRRRVCAHQPRLSEEARRRARGPGRRRGIRWNDRVVRGRGHRAHAQPRRDQARGLSRVEAARAPAGRDRRPRRDSRRSLGDRRRRSGGTATGLRRGADLGAAAARLLPGGSRRHVPRSVPAGAPGGVRRSAGRHPGRGDGHHRPVSDAAVRRGFERPGVCAADERRDRHLRIAQGRAQLRVALAGRFGPEHGGVSRARQGQGNHAGIASSR